ncbi:MAG: hypothetical protein ACOC46_01775, partial [Pirellulales bacterium]
MRNAIWRMSAGQDRHARRRSVGTANRRAGGLALLSAALAAALPLAAQAGKVSTWRDATAEDFRKGELSGVVVTSEGSVVLSRRIEPLASTESAAVWDLARDEQNNVYAAAVDPGRVLRVTPAGSAETIWQSDDVQPFAVAVRHDGTVVVGTSPDGRVLRLTADGAETLFKSDAQYIWDLAIDAAGNLYAATGPEGKVLRIDKEGKGSVFYDVKQNHVLCLAPGRDGNLYAGTDGGGLIYRIDAQGKGFVLHESGRDEVRCLLLTADGTLYAGTGSAPESGRSSLAGSSRRSTSRSSSSSSSSNNSAESSSKPGENALYRVAADGTVRQIFEEKAVFFSLLEQGPRLLIAAGAPGVVYQVDSETLSHSQLVRPDADQVLALLGRKDGSVVVGTGNPGRLHALAPGFASGGTFISRVFDAGLTSRWGALTWQAKTREGSSLSFALRSGNVDEPDETWSDWSAELTEPRNSSIPCPAARFLQYRATLKTVSPESGPTLRVVSLRYQTANQAPQITKIDVPHVAEADGKSRQEKLKLTWEASDPNDDDLRYQLWFRKEEWKNWVRLEEDLEKSEYEWDTTTVPEGTYRVRVEATDAQNNPPAEALSA